MREVPDHVAGTQQINLTARNGQADEKKKG